MTKWFLRTVLSLAAAAAAVAYWPQAQAYPQRCAGFHNSQPTYIRASQDTFCAGTGGGCTECYNLDGAFCVMSGYGFNYICDPFDHNVVIPLY